MPVPILNNRPLRLSLLTSSVVLLTACGSLSPNSKVDYRSTGEIKVTPLEVPPDLSQLTREARYAIPGGATVSASTLPGNTAGMRRAVATDSVLDVQFERLGTQRWLRVQRPPERVWEQVKTFWTTNGFILTLDNPDLGLMETDWAENRAKIPQDFLRRTLGKVLDSLYSTGERDKYRIRVERVNDTTTEIFVAHRGMEEVYSTQDKTGTRWQPRASDPSLEVEMMRRLMIHLGTTEDRANQSVTAALPSVTTSLVAWTPGETQIQFADRFDVAWRRTSVALDRAGFTVEDRDRKSGIFYVRYIDRPDETKEQGFFARLFTSNAPQAPVRMRIAVNEENPNRSRIAVQNESGQADNGAVAQRIARLIHDELK
ncbi:MAG: outer membrane protein assembly factor BamC [Alphaproteobacteria bacterium]|nr:outer membrane protein assembly factor BamC [Alphaproteobacteria bacterium]